MQKKALGRGLSALIPATDESDRSTQLQVHVNQIVPNSLQPRRSFDEVKIEELAASVRQKGVIQPLLVRRSGSGYQLVAGERRFRAAVKAGLSEVPVVVTNVTDHEALQLALIENLQREELNAIDEAHAYRRLQDEFGMRQEEIADTVGKSRPSVANAMRLLLLPDEIQREVTQGRLPVGQARALLALEREALIVSAAREIIAKGLSTREAERLVRRLKSGRRKRREGVLDPDLRSLLEGLQRSLGTKVRLMQAGRPGRGKIEIEYYSNVDFERIVGKIMNASA